EGAGAEQDSNSPVEARNGAGSAAAAATTAAPRPKGVDGLRLNAADAISPDLQHMLQMQGQHAAGHESAMGPDMYGHVSRAYPHHAMMPGAPFELLRAHHPHHRAAAYPGHHYGLPP